MRILSACEKTPRKQGKSFFETQNCSWNVVPCLLGVADRSEFTSAAFIRVPLMKTRFAMHRFLLVIIYSLNLREFYSGDHS